MNDLFSKRFFRSETFGGPFAAAVPLEALAVYCTFLGLVEESWSIGGSDFVSSVVPLGFGVGMCGFICDADPTEAGLVAGCLVLGCGDAEPVC